MMDMGRDGGEACVYHGEDERRKPSMGSTHESMICTRTIEGAIAEALQTYGVVSHTNTRTDRPDWSCNTRALSGPGSLEKDPTMRAHGHGSRGDGCDAWVVETTKNRRITPGSLP